MNNGGGVANGKLVSYLRVGHPCATIHIKCYVALGAGDLRSIKSVVRQCDFINGNAIDACGFTLGFADGFGVAHGFSCCSKAFV